MLQGALWSAKSYLSDHLVLENQNCSTRWVLVWTMGIEEL